MNQLLFVALASMIVGSLTVNADRVFVQRQQALMSTEATTTGTALAQELIEEMIVRQFDQNFPNDSTGATSPSQFSTRLGVDTLEDPGNIATFNDIDDFNGYTG